MRPHRRAGAGVGLAAGERQPRPGEGRQGGFALLRSRVPLSGQLLGELGDVQDRLDDLKRRLRELCESRPREGGRGRLSAK